MPLYEYECRVCGYRFERRQSFSEPPLKECPECGGEVYRLIQPASVVFKGSGFYVTDSRSKSPTAMPGTRKEHSDTENASRPASEAKAQSSDEAKG